MAQALVDSCSKVYAVQIACPPKLRDAFLALSFASIADDKTQKDALTKSALTAAVPGMTAETFGATLDAIRDAVLSDVRQYGAAPIATVFANGDIRGVATGTEKNTNGTGSLGVRIATSRAIFLTKVAVASTSDTVKGGFGASVLTPGAGQASSGIIDVILHRSETDFLGAVVPALRLSTSIARTTWQDTAKRAAPAPGPTPADTTRISSGTIFGLDALDRWTVGCCQVAGNPVAVVLELGYAYRWLNGDISNHPNLRMNLLGTEVKTFHGFEGGMQISLGHVTGALQLYYMRGGQQHVDGLTRLQLVTAFAVDGEIFHGPMTK